MRGYMIRFGLRWWNDHRQCFVKSWLDATVFHNFLDAEICAEEIGTGAEVVHGF